MKTADTLDHIAAEIRSTAVGSSRVEMYHALATALEAEAVKARGLDVALEQALAAFHAFTAAESMPRDNAERVSLIISTGALLRQMLAVLDDAVAVRSMTPT